MIYCTGTFNSGKRKTNHLLFLHGIVNILYKYPYILVRYFSVVLALCVNN